MTDEEKGIQSAVLRGIKPLEDLLNKMVSTDGLLGGMRLDVELIKREQSTQSMDIEAIHLDVRGLHSTVARMRSDMPKQWNTDIETKIESTLRQRDDVTGAVDAAIETERQRAEQELKTSKRVNNGFFKSMFHGSGKFVLLIVVVFAMAFGGALFTECNNSKYEQTLEDVHKALEQVNGGSPIGK